MRKLILKTAISLDGFLEGPGGEMDWFSSDDAVWQEEFKLYADVDTVLLGRGMYPGYAQHWRGVLAEPPGTRSTRWSTHAGPTGRGTSSSRAT
jgi:dihydrofolate reductase